MPDLAARAAYTWDDFVALDEDDFRELIDGELVEVEVPTRPHEAIVALLCFFLAAWTRAGHGGRALASGYKMRISQKRGVMPDPEARTLERLVLRDGEYTIRGALAEDETFSPESFEGLVIPLGEPWTA